MNKFGTKIREGRTSKGTAAAYHAEGSEDRECAGSELPDGEQRVCRIAERAYFLALERHFTPGRELDDWLQAEQEVDAGLHSSVQTGSAQGARQESGDGIE
ncbi:MAG: DUF2934 domain-containing protein [Chromatiales bacterium]|nr:DUF2934 domain-containing protein [Chromatiales bacterium]